MYKGFYNLTSAMLTHGRNLNVISNNMANVSTSGYKTDTFTAVTFDDVMWTRVGNKDKQYVDLGNQSYITAPSQLYTDYSQEGFDITGNALDFAIEGDGYFAVMTGDNQRFYTRAGNFTLDDEGYLTLPGFGRILDTEGVPIFLMTDKLNVTTDGTINSQYGDFMARIGVYTFGEDAAPPKNAMGLFEADGEAQLSENARVRNGMVERANVDWVQQITRMISAQRAYQSAAQLSKIYEEVMVKSATDLGRM